MPKATTLKKRTDRFFISLFIFLFALGLVLRLFWLERAPFGTLIDETHFGYIAYSLLQTGKDEHGVSWPLIFKGFGDQKLPAYAYLLLPFIKVFGLTVTAIRLPSVLAGSLSIVGIYFLVKELTKSQWVGLAAAGIMATNPWPFFLSRFGFESNLALLFWIVALNGLVRLHKHWKWAAVTAVFAAFTWYTYIAYRPITITLFSAYLLVLWFQHVELRKRLLKIVAIFFVAILPLFFATFSTSTFARFNQVGLFSDVGNVLIIDENRSFCGRSLPLILCSVIYNKPVLYAQRLAYRFLHVYSPQYLVSQGEDPDKYLTVERYGQLFLLLYPFFLWGCFELLFGRSQLIRGTYRWLIVLGLFLAPLPNILASEPHKVRLSSLLPFVVICTAIGLSSGMTFLQQKLNGRLGKVRTGLLALLLLIYVGMNIQFFVSFYTIHVVKNDFMYQGYVRKLIPYIHDRVLEGYDVYIQPNFSDPLMYYAFYTKMDPNEYRKQAVLGELEASGFQHTIAVDHVSVTDEPFETVACAVFASHQKALYVSKSSIEGIRPLNVITSTNGALTFNYIYDATTFAKNLPQCNTK